MADLDEVMTHWSQGVITSIEADRPELVNALTRADNAIFASIGGGMAQVKKRGGMKLVNATPLNNSSGTGPAVVGGWPYRYASGGTATRYTVLMTATGHLHQLVDDGLSDALTPTATHTGVLNTNLVGGDAAEMHNRLFVLDRKGGKTSLLGTTNVGWGVSPTTLTLLTPTGSGVMTGDYEVLVTVWDSRINAESNRSPALSVSGLSSQQLQLTVTAVGATQTHLYYRVYIRQPSNGPVWIRVLAGTGYVGGTTMGFPLASGSPTITTTINVSNAALAAGVLIPPPLDARSLPPTTAKYAAVYGRRMFVADDTNLYWSELDLPDAFHPESYEPITSPRGGNIVGLVVAADGRGLQIITTTGRHSLTGGADTRGWAFTVEERDLGAVSRGAITSYRSLLAMWAGEHYGPVLVAPSGEINYIGTDRIRPNVVETAINPAQYGHFLAASHEGRVVFGVVEPGQERVQRLLSFNIEVGAWESTNWDPMDVASVFVSYDHVGRGHLYVGNYNGQVFRLNEGTNDGVRAGTRVGTFVASSDTLTTLTDLTATFDTTGAGLKQRRVVLLGPDDRRMEHGRTHITANTGTALTLSSAITGLTPGTTYTYVIGGPGFVLETPWSHMERPFINKRFDLLYSEFRADEGVARVQMNIAFAWDPLRQLTTTAREQSSDQWDEGQWDVAYWDGLSIMNRRQSVVRTGVNYRIRIENPFPDQSFLVMKLAVKARELSDRYAGISFA